MLGCQLTYWGDLPAVGETLKYDIHVDGHANQGPIRLFFFHYDCVVDGPSGPQTRLTVRHGQAGFFTEQELLDSAGIIWTPQEQELVTTGPKHPLDKPLAMPARTAFSKGQIEADLFGLCGGFAVDRSDDDITLFKSVGHALEDLVSAAAVYRAVVQS